MELYYNVNFSENSIYRGHDLCNFDNFLIKRSLIAILPFFYFLFLRNADEHPQNNGELQLVSKQ